MEYLEFKPISLVLQKYIECFWVKCYLGNSKIQKILPDGCIDIIYNFHSSSNNKVYLVGTMTKPITANINELNISLLGIRFKPGGIFPLFPLPLDQFTDTLIYTKDIGDQDSEEWYRKLLNIQTWQGRVSLLERLLEEKYLLSNFKINRLSSLTEYILETKGNITVYDLVTKSGLSNRQLERDFKKNVGISPKLLLRIIRFRNILPALASPRHDSIMGIAFDNGYFDHAHLTKDFKIFAGTTPSKFNL